MVTVTLLVSSIAVLISGKPKGGIASYSPPTLAGPLVGHVLSKPSHKIELVKKLLLSPPNHGIAMFLA